MKGKVGIFIAVLSMLILVMGGIKGDYSNTISITPSEKTVDVDENFILNISISSEQTLTFALCNVSFDPSILEAVSIENGGMFEIWLGPGGWNLTGVAEIDNINGTITNITAFSTTGKNEGVFAKITFHSKALGTSYVNIETPLLYNGSQSVILDIVNGSVNVSTIVDTTPPEITNVVANPDEQYVDGYVNISCIITDDFGVDFAKVRISDGVVYNITMDNVGNIYFYNTTYSPGLYNFSIFAKDVNGNVNTSATYSFEIYEGDFTPPVITLIEFPSPVIHVRNVYFEWNATDDTSPEENITFSYMLEGYDTWSNWSNESMKAYNNLPAGSYTFKIKAKDDAGNIGHLNYSFEITDVSPPEITNVVANPDEQYVDGYVNISCIITDDFGVDFAKVRISDGVVYNITMDNVGNIYFYNTTYSPGLYNFSIFAKDVNGNVNTSATYSFEIYEGDSIPPVITDIVAYPPLQDAGKNVTISCMVQDNDVVKDVYVNISYPDGTYYNISITSYRIGNLFSYSHVYNMLGTYEYYICAVDNSSNWNVSPWHTFEITDLSPPSIENVVASPISQNAGGYVNISCIVIDNIMVQDIFLNITYPDDSYVNFSIKENVTDNTYFCNRAYSMIGMYSFYIYAVDNFTNGNTSAIYNFEIADNEAPVVKDIFPAGNETLSGTIVITWDATDSYYGKNLKINISYSPDGGNIWKIIAVNEQNDGAYSWDTTGLDDGKNYIIEISARDGSQNVGKKKSGTFTIDNTKPSLQIEKPLAGKIYIFDREIFPTVGNKAIIIGKITIIAEADDETAGMQKVEFWIDGNYKYEDTFAPYQWTWDEKAFSTHTIKVIAYDKAGNKKEEEVEVFIFNPL